jgi:hypothetical protein
MRVLHSESFARPARLSTLLILAAALRMASSTELTAEPASTEYPQILIHNFVQRPPMPRAQIEALAKRDLVILSPIFRHDYDDIAAIRRLNPAVKILQYALTYQVAFDDRAMLSNEEEAVFYKDYPEAWLVTAPLARLARPVTASETSLALSSPLPPSTGKAGLPLLLCDGELMRAVKLEGTQVEVLRGRCGTAACEHSLGAELVRVSQPVSWFDWYRGLTERSEVVDINISDRAPPIHGRQPWQIKADYLVDRLWNDPQWRKAFDGFFLDEGQAQVASTEFDLDRDGRSDTPYQVRASMQRGLRLLCARLRERCGPEAIIVLNNNPDIIPDVNGRHREHFADMTLVGGNEGAGWLGPFVNWAYSVQPLRGWADLGHPPVTALNSSQPGAWDDYRQMRFGLASVLLFEGYYQYRAHSGDRGNWQHWFDEYSVDQQGRATDGSSGRHWLGQPLGPPHQHTTTLDRPVLRASAKWEVDTILGAAGNVVLEQHDGQVQIALAGKAAAGSSPWAIRAAWDGSWKPKTEYTLTLEARSSTPQLIEGRLLDENGKAAASRIVIPFYVTPTWQRYVITCYDPGDKPLRPFALAFAANGQLGELALRDIALQEGTVETGWTREFARGLIVVNPTRRPQRIDIPSGFRRIAGTQAPDHNNGKPVAGPLLVAPLDAYLLQRLQ